jgi:hypothetical protein
MLKWSLNQANLKNFFNQVMNLDWTKQWIVTIQEFRSKRSDVQNDRLWKLYTSIGNHLGIEKDKIHELMGYKFLRYQSEIAGMPVELIKSTTKLTTKEMAEYQEQVEFFASTMGWGWDL